MNTKFSKATLFLAAFAIGVLMALSGQVIPAIVLVSLVGAALGFNREMGKCYANTLTNLIPDIYAALDVVSEELVGFIPAVMRDSTADRVAKGQNLDITQTLANTAGKDITPAMSLPAAADQTIAPKQLTISKYRAFPFSWSGEEQKAVDYGPGYLTVNQYQIAQAIRAANNEIELFLAKMIYQGSSRAYGTAGTTPFTDSATGYNGTVTASAQMRKILDDNGAPATDRSVVVNTTAGAALRSLFNLTKANESGTTDVLRKGSLLSLHGADFRESAQVVTTTVGTGASYTSDTAGYAIGATVITLITGTGTVLAGDVVTFSGDTTQYVVSVGTAAAGAITLAAPGLRKALPAQAKAMTITAAFAANAGFSRNAHLLATRLPAVPKEGDIAIAREVVTSPKSGLSYEIAVYPGYRMVLYEVGIAYGGLTIKPEHSAILLG